MIVFIKLLYFITPTFKEILMLFDNKYRIIILFSGFCNSPTYQYIQTSKKSILVIELSLDFNYLNKHLINNINLTIKGVTK